MKLYLDTSTENTILRLDEKEYSAPLKNQLAEQIFTFIHDKLVENQADWTDLTEITFFAGPGSFTGLRIGAAVVNALADQLQIPLKNQDREVVPIILPNYGRPANITPSKKSISHSAAHFACAIIYDIRKFMDQDLHQNQNNQKPQTIGGVTFSAGLSHPVTPQVSPGSNQPSFAKPASEQSNITAPQPTIPSPADLFNNNSAAFSAPQSTPVSTPATENPANAYQANNYTSPAASAEQIFAAETTNNFYTNDNSNPFGENGFTQAARNGNPNSNQSMIDQSIQNAAMLNQATEAQKNPGQEVNNGPEIVYNQLNVPVASPTHFEEKFTVVDPNASADKSAEAAKAEKEAKEKDPRTIAMKALKKMTTMAMVFGILSVLFLVLSLIGLVYGISQGDKITTANNTIKNQSQIIAAVEESSGVAKISTPADVPVYKTTLGYIYLSDWNIKLKVPDNLSTMSYVLNTYEYRNSICFNGIQKGVQAKQEFADPAKNLGKQGCLVRVPVSEGDFEASTGKRFGTKVTTYKDYNFFYTDPTISSKDGTELGLETASNQIIRNMIFALETYE